MTDLFSEDATSNKNRAQLSQLRSMFENQLNERNLRRLQYGSQENKAPNKLSSRDREYDYRNKIQIGDINPSSDFDPSTAKDGRSSAQEQVKPIRTTRSILSNPSSIGGKAPKTKPPKPWEQIGKEEARKYLYIHDDPVQELAEQIGELEQKIEKEQQKQERKAAQRNQLADNENLITTKEAYGLPQKKFEKMRQILRLESDSGNYNSQDLGDAGNQDKIEGDFDNPLVHKSAEDKATDKSKKRRVQFKDVYDSRSIQQIRQERLSRERELGTRKVYAPTSSFNVSQNTSLHDASAHIEENHSADRIDVVDQGDPKDYLRALKRAEMSPASIDPLIQPPVRMHTEEQFAKLLADQYPSNQRSSEGTAERVKRGFVIQSSRTELVVSRPSQINFEKQSETATLEKPRQESHKPFPPFNTQQNFGQQVAANQSQMPEGFNKMPTFMPIAPKSSSLSSCQKSDSVPGIKAGEVSLSHKKILERALALMSQEGDSSIKKERPPKEVLSAKLSKNYAAEEKGKAQLISRGREILSEPQTQLNLWSHLQDNFDFRKIEKSSALDDKVAQYQKANRHKIYCKFLEGFDALASTTARVELRDSLLSLAMFAHAMEAKERRVRWKPFSRTLLGKEWKRKLLKTWIETLREKQSGDRKQQRATNYFKMNQRVRLKMVIQKMRKLLKVERKNSFKMRQTIFRKVYIRAGFTAWFKHAHIVEPMRTRAAIKKKREVFKAILEKGDVDRELAINHYRNSRKAKLFKFLATYKQTRISKAKAKSIAAAFLRVNLLHKVLRALGWKVKRNAILRKDLVKRYWIDNSDEEGSELLDGNSEFHQGPEYAQDFSDEFFPVVVHKRKKMLNIADPTRTFMYDTLEARPQMVIFMGSENVDVTYKDVGKRFCHRK